MSYFFGVPKQRSSPQLNTDIQSTYYSFYIRINSINPKWAFL
jgi:hypothetical protein